MSQFDIPSILCPYFLLSWSTNLSPIIAGRRPSALRTARGQACIRPLGGSPSLTAGAPDRRWTSREEAEHPINKQEQTRMRASFGCWCSWTPSAVAWSDESETTSHIHPRQDRSSQPRGFRPGKRKKEKEKRSVCGRREERDWTPHHQVDDWIGRPHFRLQNGNQVKPLLPKARVMRKKTSVSILSSQTNNCCSKTTKRF